MGMDKLVRDRLRERLRTERERRGWSQAELTHRISNHGVVGWYPSTVAKIEAGDRSVYVHELLAFADLFGVTVDTLLGRRPDVSDVLWATSRLSSNAAKMAADISGLQQRVGDDLRELINFADRERKRESIQSPIDLAAQAVARLAQAHEALTALASEFPLPGMKLERSQK